MDVLVLVVGLAVLVGLAGIVLPILPGSATIAIAVGVWAAVRSSPASWGVFAAVAVLLVIGWASSYLITGRTVAAAGVPTRSIMVAGLAGIVGFFVIPVVGLLVFFAAGLYTMEYLRLRDLVAARDSAWLAVRATGLGMLVELALALVASSIWLAAALTGVGT